MFRRRRPIARAAVVGGAAYAAGKHRGANQAEEEIASEEAQAAADAAASKDAAYEQLEKLAKLKDQGVLTQEEFDAQKAKILASM
jgi:Short C-terminal domain